MRKAIFICALDSVCFLLVLAGITGLYYPVLVTLSQDWLTNDNYSHGYLVPLISGYMIFSIRRQFKYILLAPVNWGFLLLLVGLLQFYVGKVGSELFLQRASIIPVLLGVILFLFGVSTTRKLFLPIVYLIFMVPLPAIIWNQIAFPLQLYSSAITEKLIQLLGIPVLREGNILHLAQTNLEVVDACSGLRSLTTMFALSFALGWFSNFAIWKKWVLFILAAPIAILANIIRLTGTACLAYFYGEKVAQGFLHDLSGLATFVFGTILLLLLKISLQENPSSK